MGVDQVKHAWSEIASLTVIDDNHLPYLTVPLESRTGGTPSYSAKNIDSFIVPLPEKIFYPADAVDKMANYLIGGPIPFLKQKDDIIFRYFVTTGSAFTKFVRSHETQLDSTLVQEVMQLPFAQFVWVIEFATKDEWNTRQISARAVLDATASERESIPLWLLHNKSEAYLFSRSTVSNDDAKVLKFGTEHATLARMEQNLRHIQTK